MLPVVFPTIGAMFQIPTRLLEGRVILSELRADLTVDYYDAETDTTTPIKIYRDIPGGIAVPRAYGRKRFPDLYANARDVTTHAKRNRALFPHNIKPRDEQQREFWSKLKEVFGSANVSERQAKARTGSGKTVGYITANADIGNWPILIVVHTNRLKEQWLGDIAQKNGLRFIFGEQWVKDNVGIIQQDRCEFLGKKIVIAMGPSLARRNYPKALYRYFGVVGYDEIHKFATPDLSRCLSLFYAANVFSMSATPRKGPLAKVINAFFGKPSITSEQEVMQPTVTRVRFAKEVNWFDYKTNKPCEDKRLLANFLMNDTDRQDLLTDIIYLRGVKRDRQCLVLSDRVAQLQDFIERLKDMGVPEADLGLYVGSYESGKKKLTGYLECAGVKLHFRGLPGFDDLRAARKYVAEKAKLLAQSVELSASDVENHAKIADERLSPTPEQYKYIEHNCRYIFATYQIFADGLDIGRIDWGMEALPRADVEQALGRVIRIKEGKLVPEWITIADELHTTIRRELPGGQIHTISYKYKEPGKLELRRLASYHNQNAILKRMDNPREAFQSQKAQGY